MISTADARAMLAEYAALPPEMGRTRLDWIDAHPPPVVPILCRACGSRREIQLSWSDVERELDLHGSLPEQLDAMECERCEEPSDGE